MITIDGERYNPVLSEWVRPPRQARSEETLLRFLDATAELLAERPFDEISVNDIVDRAERTVGSFYARFEDKVGVLRVLVEQSAARLREGARDFFVVQSWEGIPLELFVEEAVRQAINAYRTAGPVFRAATLQAPSDAAFRAERLSVFRTSIDAFAEVIESHAGAVTHPDPRRAAQFVMTQVIAALDLRLIYGPELTSLSEDDEALCEDLVEMTWGVLGRPC